MQLALTWFSKEWLAQRGTLGAYLGLSFAAVTCVFWLQTIETGHNGVVPVEGRAGIVVLFLAAAAFAVAGLAAPQLVRGEMHGGADHFLRRLPGALRPACAGKLAFLLLVACVLPVLGLVAAPHVLQRGTPRFGVSQRYWRLYRESATFVLDAMTLGCEPALFDAEAKQYVAPRHLRPELVRELRANTPLRASGDRRVWVDDDRLCVEGERGEVVTSRWDPRDVLLWSRGHAAVVARSDGKNAWLDVTTGHFVAIAGDATAFAAGGHWLVRQEKVEWQRLDPGTGATTPAPALAGHTPLVLLDDDTVLTQSWERIDKTRIRYRLFAYSVATGTLAPIGVDESLRDVDLTCVGPGNGPTSPYGLRDPKGRLWLHCRRSGDPEVQTFYIAVDTSTCTASATPVRDVAVLAFLDARTLLASTPIRPGQLGKILRIDVETGAQAVLFPRAR